MFLMYALVVVALATQAILGLPHTITELEKREKPVPCYPISKYSVEVICSSHAHAMTALIRRSSGL